MHEVQKTVDHPKKCTSHIWLFFYSENIWLLPLIGAACQILRACLSGVGSIAERKPGQNKSRLIQIRMFRKIDKL